MGREGNPLFYPAGRSGASAGGAVRQRLAAQLELAAARLVAAFADPVLHLPALRLARLGVTRLYGNDSGPAWCTVGNPQHYFSYRRDQQRLGGSGRMAACIWRT